MTPLEHAREECKRLQAELEQAKIEVAEHEEGWHHARRTLVEAKAELEKAQAVAAAYAEIQQVREQADALLGSKYLGWNWVHALVDALRTERTRSDVAQLSLRQAAEKIEALEAELAK